MRLLSGYVDADVLHQPTRDFASRERPVPGSDVARRADPLQHGNACDQLSADRRPPLDRAFADSEPRGRWHALPGGIETASLVGLLLPGWGMIAVLRGLESVLRNSLHRSGYELRTLQSDNSS